MVLVALVCWLVTGPGIWGQGALPNRREARSILRASVPFGSFIVVNRLSVRIPEIALSVLAGPLAMGWYQAANRIADVAEQPGAIMATALYPRLAASEEGGQEQTRLLAAGSAVLVVFGLAITLGILVAP